MAWRDALVEYVRWTAPLALLFLVAERLRPAWRGQRMTARQVVTGLADGAAFAVAGAINVILFGALDRPLWRALEATGAARLFVAAGAVRGLPLAGQIAIAVVASDLLDYWIHRALHASPLLWTFHQTHHSVRDGEMGFLVGLGRVHVVEMLVYNVALFLPMHLLAVRPEAVAAATATMTFAAFFTHANLDLGRGLLARLVVTPRMHHWHHAREAPGGRVYNFAARLALWDWLFGTAHLPSEKPPALGFPGDEAMRDDALGHQLWPLVRRQ